MRLHRVTHQIGKFREYPWPAGHTEAKTVRAPPTASFRPFGPDTVMRTARVCTMVDSSSSLGHDLKAEEDLLAKAWR